MSRLRDLYVNEVAPALMKKFEYKSPMQIPKIEKVVREHPDFEKSGIKILHAENMEQAVQLMYENTSSGDIVSFCPASASFDLYANFEERGRHFKRLVNRL